MSNDTNRIYILILTRYVTRSQLVRNLGKPNANYPCSGTNKGTLIQSQQMPFCLNG